MDITDPIVNIAKDRLEARSLGDKNADICFLALADLNGRASIRTLVLREISDNRFMLFINQSSPKWRILTGGGHYELLLWFPSKQRQYRISGTISVVDSDIVKHNWQRRPLGSKLLDLVYEETFDQSAEIESRQQLLDEVGRIRSNVDLDELKPPEKVGGIELVAEQVEMLDLNNKDRIHDRRLFRLKGDSWQTTTLVP